MRACVREGEAGGERTLLLSRTKRGVCNMHASAGHRRANDWTGSCGHGLVALERLRSPGLVRIREINI